MDTSSEFASPLSGAPVQPSARCANGGGPARAAPESPRPRIDPLGASARGLLHLVPDVLLGPCGHGARYSDAVLSDASVRPLLGLQFFFDVTGLLAYVVQVRVRAFAHRGAQRTTRYIRLQGNRQPAHRSRFPTASFPWCLTGQAAG